MSSDKLTNSLNQVLTPEIMNYIRVKSDFLDIIMNRDETEQYRKYLYLTVVLDVLKTKEEYELCEVVDQMIKEYNIT